MRASTSFFANPSETAATKIAAINQMPAQYHQCSSASCSGWGGVSLVGDELLFVPLRNYVRRYVFPPLDGTFDVVSAQLGEEVVVHGALALAAAG